MDEEDNNSSRMDDTDSSDFTFYSATSSPDVSWESFASPKATNPITAQSTQTPVSSESGIDWFESFFDPAICDLDSVFEDMEPTLVGTDSAFIKPGSESSNKPKQTTLEIGNQELNPATTPIEFPEFISTTINTDFSMNSFEAIAQEEIFDEPITAGFWNSSNSFTDSGYERFDDRPSFQTDGSTITDLESTLLESSSFSEVQPSQNPMDLTRESESEHTLVPTHDTREPSNISSVRCVDSSVIASVSQTDAFRWGDEWTSSVSRDLNHAKVGYELGDTLSINPVLAETEEGGQSDFFGHLPIKTSISSSDNVVTDSDSNSDFDCSNQEFQTADDGDVHSQASGNNRIMDIPSRNEKTKEKLTNSMLKDTDMYRGIKSTLPTFPLVRPKLRGGGKYIEENTYVDVLKASEPCLTVTSLDMFKDLPLASSLEMVNLRSPAESIKVRTEESFCTSQNLYSGNSLNLEKSAVISRELPTEANIRSEMVSSANSVAEHSISNNTGLPSVGDSLSASAVMNSLLDFQNVSPLLSDSCETAERTTCDYLCSSTLIDAPVTESGSLDHLNSLVNNKAINTEIIDTPYDKNNDQNTEYFSLIVEDHPFHTGDYQNIRSTSEVKINKVRYLHSLKRTDNLEGTALEMTSTNTSKKITNIKTSDTSEKDSDISFDSYLPNLNQPENTNTETSFPMSETSSNSKETNPTLFMESRNVTKGLSESSSSKEKTDSLVDKCDCKSSLLPEKAVKLKGRRNSDPSGIAACSLLTPLSKYPFLGPFRDVDFGKRPKPSETCDSGFQSESRKMVGRNSLKNSLSESNLVSLLKEDAVSLSRQVCTFSNTVSRNTKHPNTDDVSGRLISIQSNETGNKAKEVGHQSAKKPVNKKSSRIKSLLANTPQIASKKSTYLLDSVESSHRLDDPDLSVREPEDYSKQKEKIKKRRKKRKKDSAMESHASGERSIIQDTCIKSTSKILNDPLCNPFTPDAKDSGRFLKPNHPKKQVKSAKEISPDSTISYLSGTSYNISPSSLIRMADTKKKITKKSSHPKAPDSRKSIITNMRRCTASKETGYELRGDDIAQQGTPLKKPLLSMADAFSLENLRFADTDGDSKGRRLGNKNVTRIKRSSSLPETLEQLKSADLSPAKLSSGRSGGDPVTTPTAAVPGVPLKKCTDPHNAATEGRVDSERRTSPANSDRARVPRSESPSDIGEGACLSLPDISPRPASISDADNGPDAWPAAVKRESAMTRRRADAKPLLRPEVSRDPSLTAPAGKTLEFSDLCDELDNRDSSWCSAAETANSDAPEKINTCQQEASLYSSETPLYQKSSREPGKESDMITTQSVLKKSIASTGSRNIFTAKTSTTDPPSDKRSFESNWDIQQTAGFILNENDNINNSLSIGSVSFEAVNVPSNLKTDTRDVLPEKLCESLFVPTISDQSGLTNTTIFDISKDSDQAPVVDSAKDDQNNEYHPVEIICKRGRDFVLETTDKDKVKQTESETHESVETREELADNESSQDLKPDQTLEPTVDGELSEKFEFLLNPVSNGKQDSPKTKRGHFGTVKNCTENENDLVISATPEIRSTYKLLSERDFTMKRTSSTSALSRGSVDACRVTDTECKFDSNPSSFETEKQITTSVLDNSECEKVSLERKSRSFPILSAKYGCHSKIERIYLQRVKDGSFGSGDTVQEVKSTDLGIGSKTQMNLPSLSRIKSEEAMVETVQPLSIQELKVSHASAVTNPVQTEPVCSESQLEPWILELGNADQDKETLDWTVEARTDLATGRIVPTGKFISVKMPEDYAIPSVLRGIQSDEHDMCVVLQPRSASCYLPLEKDSSQGNISKLSPGQEYVTGQRASENRFGGITCCCCYFPCAGLNQTNPAE